ncbi:uncharacterized protein LOC134234095 [Saccostrea cucullata]|uniref:uncharacterized protein LOC134234095 n=1 Tax=Saccostrea cuccullata TaxID=36930 RepID=UPI002ED33C0C
MPKQGKRKSYRSRLQQMRLYATQRTNEDTEMGYDTKLKADTEEKYDPTMMQDGKKQTDQKEEKKISTDSFNDPANEKDFHSTSQQSETDQTTKDEWKTKRKKESTRKRMAKYRQGMSDEQKRERKGIDKRSKQDKREHLPEEIKENIKASDRKRKRDIREQLPEEIKENASGFREKKTRDIREQLPEEIKKTIKASDRNRRRDKREQLPEEIKEIIKASDQKRKKDKREQLPEEIKEIIKASDQKRKKDKREQLPEEIKENIKASDQKRKKDIREHLPEEIKENIKASDQKRKKDKREHLPEEIKENIKASDQKRKKDKREHLPEETKEIIKTSDRKRKKDKRRNLPDKEKTILKAKERKRLSNYRQKMPSDLRDSVRISDRNKKKDIREQLPEGTKQFIKASERKRKQDKREQLPKEIKKTIKATDQKRKKDKREQLPKETKEIIKASDQKRKKDKREHLPKETKEIIKTSDRKRKQEKREHLPEEIKKTMKASEKKRKQDKREHLPNEKKNEIRTRDQQRKSVNKKLNLQNPYQTFLHKIKSGPSFVCICCNRLLYEQTVNKITKNTFKTVDPDVLNEALPGWCFDQKEISYICKTCILSLHKKKIPGQATVNELHLTELKEPLISLTDFEARLVSQRLIFMKILALPRGRQKAVHGTVVNVPVDSSQTCTLLPRLPTNSGLIPVKLKRKLEYRGHVEFQHISPDRVISSLLFLKENNEFYKDVPVLENWKDLAAGDNPSLWERLTEPHTKKNESVDDDSGNPDQRTDPHNEEDNTHSSDGVYEHSTLGNDDDEWSGEDDDLLNAEEISQTRGIAYDTCIQQEYRGNEIISIAPGEGKTPVSLLTDDNNEVLAFPKLFPDGKFGFDTKRKIKLSLSRYINARLLHRDGRFARNSDYIFYAQHIRDLQHINGSISVAMRKASSSKLNAGLAKDPSQLSALILKDHGYKFLTQIRGSPAYFDKMLLELLACVKQLGSFTWFITLSAADLQWPEGIQIIGRQYGHNFTDQDVKDMTWEERCRWIRQNPVTIARHFDYRLKQFIKNVLLSPQQPVGKVTMYMYRIEFQQRGSPHAHMAFWVEGTPDFENSTDEEIRNFHDQYVSCDIPTDDEELCELVKKVQSHVHSPSCRKPGKNCRFSFPKPPTDRTIIIKTVKKTDENQQAPSSEPANMTDAQVKEILSLVYAKLDELGEDMTTEHLLKEIGLPEKLYYSALSQCRKTDAIIMKRQPSQKYVNNYNPTLLKLWKANMDIQLVCNPYACIMYIASYISKAERTLGDLLKSISKECSNMDITRQLRTVASKFLTHREVSAQEATFRVLSLPLCYFDRQRIFVSTNPPTERVKLLKPRAVIEQMEDDDEDIYQVGLLDKYSMRPLYLSDICLAEFAVTYTTSYSNFDSEDTNPEVIGIADDLESPHYITLTDGKKMVRRKKTAVIRTHKVSQKKNPEKYSYALLLLYVPWRNEEKDIGPCEFEGDFFQKKLTMYTEQINAMMLRFEKHAQLIEEALDDIEENGPPDPDAWGHLAPETVQANLDAAREGSMDDENADFMDPGRNRVPNGDPSLESPQVIYEVLASRLTDHQWREHIHSLNEEQTLVHNFFVTWCTRLCQSKKMPPKPDAFHIFVSGGAGTGKSHLIKTIQESAFRLLRPVTETSDEITVLTAAPTGTAAFNVFGMTLHSAFLLPVMKGFSTYKPLSQEKLNTLRCKLSSLKVIIIDEISMVSADMLLFLHRRLQEITGSSEIFGGLSIFTFGDLFQLPPPAQRALFDQPSDEIARLYGSLWKNHFKVVELQQIMRQRDDLSFARLLNRVRSGQHTNDDVWTLCTRETNDPPEDILHVYTTNKAVDSYNNKKLESLSTSKFVVRAQDSKKDVTTGAIAVNLSDKATETGGLRSTLHLAVGARIMLTYNVSTADGLVNGAKGTVKGFIPTPPTTADDNYTPNFILIEFDNPNIGHQTRILYGRLLQHQSTVVPIVRQQVQVQLGKHSTVHAVRFQFPLTLAWATTIHKVQGETLNSIVIHCNGQFQPGQLYVALSRVKSLNGLYLVNFDSQKIKTSAKTIAEMERLMNSMKFFPPDTLSYLPDSNSMISISAVNAQSLHRHFVDVINHPSARSAHILGVTETFLMPSDSDSDYGWKNHHIFRKDRHHTLENTTPPTSRTQHSAHGGVAVYVSDHYCVEFICQICHIPVECIALVLFNRNSSLRFCFVVTYRPPNQTLDIYLTHMDNVMKNIPHLNIPTLISGDFNVNLLQESPSQKLLETFFASYGFQQIIDSPTHISGSLLDHMYCNFAIPTDVYKTVQPTYFSQHSFVQIIFPR